MIVQNPVASTLHHKTVAKIRRMVSEKRAKEVNTLELKMFYDMYASEQEKRAIGVQCQNKVFPRPTDAELESAMDFTVIQQEADPLNDIVEEPPTRQLKKDGWLYTYGTYVDLFRAGLLVPEEDSSLGDVLVIAQKFGEDLSFNGKVEPPGEDSPYYRLWFAAHEKEPPASTAVPVSSSTDDTKSAPSTAAHPINNTLEKTTRKTNMDTFRCDTVPQHHRSSIVPSKDAPAFGDKSWDDYVLSLLRPNEVAEVTAGGNRKIRCPRNVGLRRVLQELIGPIVSVSSDVQCVPDRNNRYLTVARTKVSVDTLRQDHPAFGHVVTWEDFGNNYSSDDSASDVIMSHPVTSAQTSAESRCFKKILGLGAVYSAEEMVKTQPRKEWNPDADVQDRPTDHGKPIDPMQVQFINNVCDKYHTSPLDAASQLFGKKIESLNELSFKDGLRLQAKVNEFNHQKPAESSNDIF